MNEGQRGLGASFGNIFRNLTVLMNTETPDSFEKFEDLRPLMQETLGRDIGVFKKVVDARISII